MDDLEKMPVELDLIYMKDEGGSFCVPFEGGTFFIADSPPVARAVICPVGRANASAEEGEGAHQGDGFIGMDRIEALMQMHGKHPEKYVLSASGRSSGLWWTCQGWGSRRSP